MSYGQPFTEARTEEARLRENWGGCQSTFIFTGNAQAAVERSKVGHTSPRGRTPTRNRTGTFNRGSVVVPAHPGCADKHQSSQCIDWWSQGESNPRPLECHSSALPTELWPHSHGIGNPARFREPVPVRAPARRRHSPTPRSQGGEGGAFSRRS